MEDIAFRYSDAEVQSLSFDGEAALQKKHRSLKLTDLICDSTVESGVLLSGRKYSHVLWTHKSFEVVVSSDSIATQADLNFLQEFWKAKFKYVSLKSGSTWGDYFEVATEGGLFPLSYIEDVRSLKEVSFVLSTVNPEPL